MIKTARRVRPFVSKSSGLAVLRVVKDQDQVETVAADKNTDWIKPAIANVLNKATPDVDVRVRVEKVDYGIWIWDEQEQLHDHVPMRILNSMMGKEGSRQFSESVDLVKMSWDDLRPWKGVEV